MKTQTGLKRKIKTVSSIQKVTRATAAIANIRLQNLSTPLRAMQKYQESLAACAKDIAAHLKNSDNELLARYFRKGRTAKVLFIVFTSDKGLCGVYNSRLLAELAEATRTQIRLGRKLSFVSFGRHAAEHLAKMNRNVILSRPAVSLAGAETLSKELVKECFSMFDDGTIDEVHIFYNRYFSAGKQIMQSSVFLPLDAPGQNVRKADPGEEGITGASWTGAFRLADFEFDAAAERFLNPFFYHYLEVTMRRIILESAAGEQAARMSAMQESTSNADELIKNLSMKYNKMRQAKITGELIEVVSSAEALN